MPRDFVEVARSIEPELRIEEVRELHACGLHEHLGHECDPQDFSHHEVLVVEAQHRESALALDRHRLVIRRLPLCQANVPKEGACTTNQFALECRGYFQLHLANLPIGRNETYTLAREQENAILHPRSGTQAHICRLMTTSVVNTPRPSRVGRGRVTDTGPEFPSRRQDCFVVTNSAGHLPQAAHLSLVRDLEEFDKLLLEQSPVHSKKNAVTTDELEGKRKQFLANSRLHSLDEIAVEEPMPCPIESQQMPAGEIRPRIQNPKSPPRMEQDGFRPAGRIGPH